jgi:hypothetical protein
MSALSEQPPPRKGAKAGYYPDPLGGKRARWWDGANWGHMLGPPVAADAARGKAIAPPTKVCRHCGAQSETFDSTCPNCGRSYTISRGMVIGATLGVVLLVLFLGGCVAVLATLDTSDDDEALSKAEFDTIRIGTPKSSVERRFGGPASTSEIEQGQRRYVCDYYDDSADRFDENDYFELCYLNGLLFSKRDFS